MAISDVDLIAQGNYSGSSITLCRNGNVQVEDQFSGTGVLSSLIEGTRFSVSGNEIGTVTQNSAGKLVLIFNNNATSSLVNAVLSGIAYNNISDVPLASVQINWLFSDGNTGTQGTGGALTATASTKVNITAVNDNFSGSVTISGTARQGQTLTAANTLADADGMGTISYQWKADGVNISGATSSTLTLAQTQVGKAISVTASYTDLGNTAESVTSSVTSSVANVNDAPTGRVTISGTAKQGETLTAANTLADADGLGAISYQWKADGVNISGAVNSTLPLSQTHVGKLISVEASYTDAGNTVESVASIATVAVNNVNDVPTGSVTISGTALQGQTLTAANNLADADGLGAISFQWKADGVNISGATSSTITLAQTQVGKTVTVAASYTDGGNTAESVVSTATASVQALATGSNLTGQIYQWKSHTLLSGAEISLAGLSSPVLSNSATPLYEFKNVELNSATGVVQMGLWMNLSASIKNFDLNLKNEEGQALG
ncbi:MAG: hypothetical protein NTX67_08040, partial [Burkholderiales bacterium]|nr:hypothetical protein [Burkholderiales bacterium]